MRSAVLYFHTGRGLMLESITDSVRALLSMVLQTETPQLVFSESSYWPYTQHGFGKIFGHFHECLRTSKQSHKS